MKIWGRIYRDNKAVSDALSDAEAQKASDVHDWTAILDDICKKLDLSRPVILKNTKKSLKGFQEPCSDRPILWKALILTSLS